MQSFTSILFIASVAASPSPQAAVQPSGSRTLTSSVTGPHCNNGNLAFELGTDISPQPMAENGFATYTATFTNNGASVPLVSISAYNMQPTVSGNGFTFSETDDIPAVGEAVVVGVACDSATNSATLNGIQVTYTSQNNIQLMQTLTGGAGSGTAPSSNAGAGTGSSAGTGAGNSAGNGNGTIVGPGSAGIVLSIGADPAQNGGQGINDLKCDGQGQVQTTLNFLASINVNNIHAYQPMAEIGLPTVTASFTLGGQPATVNVQNTFNVASSTVSNNQWIFGLMDDGPHPGGIFTLGACINGAVPPVAVTFSSTPVTDAQGLPHGADGGPPVPAVNGPVSVVNELPAQFQGSGSSSGSGAGSGAGSGVGNGTTQGAGSGTGAVGTFSGARGSEPGGFANFAILCLFLIRS